MAKAMGPFRDSQAPSWLSGPRADIPAEPPLVALHNGYVLCKNNTGGNICTPRIANTFIKISSYKNRHNFSLIVL